MLLNSGELLKMKKEYDRLSNWSDGWMILSTDGWDGARGQEFNKKKLFHTMVPMGDGLEYFSKPKEVALRLLRAAQTLCARYNQQQGRKKPATWRESISETCWRNTKGKMETTVFEVILSTYNFHQQAVVAKVDQRHREGLPRGTDIDRDALVAICDIKVS